MDRDSEISDWDEMQNVQQNVGKTLETTENGVPRIPVTDGGGVDRIDFSDDDEEVERVATRYDRLRTKYETFRNKYDNLTDKHIETQDELNTELRNQNELIIDEYGDVIDLLEERRENYEELEQAYKQVRQKYSTATDRLVYTLDDFSDSKRATGIKDAFQGTLFALAGFIAADQYSFEGAIEFYANAPMYYANDPETAILTLGLPLLGAWYIKNAFSNWRDARELGDAADEWRRHRFDEDLKDVEETSRTSSVDTIPDFD